jgi:hypothetical protein
MNENEFDLAARAWLDDGPTRMSDRPLLSALDEIHTTRQRRVVWPAWRATPVNIFARVATAAVLVVGVGLLAVNVLPHQPDGSSAGGRSPSPSPARSLDFPSLTTTFVSPRNGFSIKHPANVALTPATQLLGFGPHLDDGFDVLETGLAATFKGGSTGTPDMENGFVAGSLTDTIDIWVDDRLNDYGGCAVPRSRQAEVTIDGQSGRIAECAGRIDATVIAGRRLYVFTLSHVRTDARAVFDAFVATIDLTPQTAVDFPAMTTTFVSPTYGYSYKFFDRGGLRPATERWDPGNQPLDDRNFDDRFDALETGLSAYFESASTEIPRGVSIDAWVDEYVTPPVAGGCGITRGQQAEITIDGQAGRIAECDHTEATVVAGGRLYLFIGPGQSSRNRAWFDAWIATIDLRPGDAAVHSSTPSS